MAGIAEHLPIAATQDDFWTWREAMYSLALRLTPEEMEAIATMLYAEMLRHGITAVTEFHYLHQDPQGRPYADLAEMGSRILAAAQRSGIHVTLVPVMYEQGGFGRPLTKGQLRFNTFGLSGYDQLLGATRDAARGLDDVIIGRGIHSLRAVSTADTLQLLSQGTDGPIHLHIAEQTKEVNDCVAALKKRPVEWLLAHLPVDHRYHLVHATHMTGDEARDLGRSKATVVVCPSTEGNLGDGIFRLRDYRSTGGGCAIGTDSQIGLSPFEELRWLDYVQRLTAEKRNVVCQKGGDDSGTLLLTEAWDRGRSAMGQEHDDFFAVGQPFDGVVIDPQHPTMLGKPEARRIGALIYGGDPTCLLGTIRRGQWLVTGGKHRHDGSIKQAYAKAVQALWSDFRLD
jgi:formimidoylglutamate deiminase